jgi:phage FluMu protein Com
MAAKLRIKCPHCGEVNNFGSVNDTCPKCNKPLGLEEEGSIYIYRQGSPYGVASGFGLFINEQPHGYIGNKELLRIPVKFGTYNIHSAVGMSRKCKDLQVTVTPENPVVYTKVYIKPGFWTNSFVVEYVDPKLLDL